MTTLNLTDPLRRQADGVRPIPHCSRQGGQSASLTRAQPSDSLPPAAVMTQWNWFTDRAWR